ncbi:MAG TPA: Ig-like domain-containing protein, partial [Vicinamibacteria bacterium]|nr:Ig-like domain-containing protein [Vicinamibacteria bacterium]
MRFPSARRSGRVLASALACSLVAASVPAFSQTDSRLRPGSRPTERVERKRFAAQDDAYGVSAGDVLMVAAPGLMANDVLVDVGADEAVVSLVSGPAHGSLVLDPSGAFEYLPGKGFTGVDGFRYGLTFGQQYAEANVLLNVVAPTDLALTATASAPAVSIGTPVVFTFDVVNQGLADAEGVQLEVRIPAVIVDRAEPAASAGAIDPACVVIARNHWMCLLGRVPAGAATQVTLPFLPQAAGYVLAEGYVSSLQPDVDPMDDRASAQTVAGRVFLTADLLTGRQPWGPSQGLPDVRHGFELVNDYPAATGFQASAIGAEERQSNIDWLQITPAVGQVAAFGVQSFSVSMLAEGVAPGLKRGRVRVTHDAPFKTSDVRVSFTVAFKDVEVTRPQDAFIHALAGANVTAGCDAGYFCPDEPLVRGGATVWLLLAREGSGYTPEAAQGLFKDVEVERADAAFVEELVRRGVADPCDVDLFCPENPLARADAAVMVLRMLYGVRYLP